MSTEWWIARGLRDAGMSKSAARCVVRGAIAHLTPEQRTSIRLAISRPEPMPDVRDPDSLLALSQGELAPEVHHVLAYYVGQCRDRP